MKDDLDANVDDDAPSATPRPPRANGLLVRAKAFHWIIVGFVFGLALGLWLISLRTTPPTAAARTDAATVVLAAADERPAFANVVGNTSPDGGDATPSASDVSVAPVVATAEQSPPAAAATHLADTRATTSFPPPNDETPTKLDIRTSKPPAADDKLRHTPTVAKLDKADGRERAPRQESGRRCTLSVGAGSLSLRAGGSAVIVAGTDDLSGNGQVTAATSNWSDIAVFAESRGGGSNVGGRVRFRVISVSRRAGAFAVNFKSRCGAKTIPVIVTSSGQ